MLTHEKWQDKIVGIVSFLIIMLLSFASMWTLLSSPLQVINGTVVAILTTAPAVAFSLALVLSEFILRWPVVIRAYVKGFSIVLELLLSSVCMMLPGNYLAQVVAVLSAIYFCAYFLSKRHQNLDIWLKVLDQIKSSTRFGALRFGPVLIAFAIQLLLLQLLSITFYMVLRSYSGSWLNQLIFAFMLVFFYLQALCKLVLRGALTAHFVNHWLLAGSSYEKPKTVTHATLKLLSYSLGSISIAAFSQAIWEAVMAFGILFFFNASLSRINTDHSWSAFGNILVYFFIWLCGTSRKYCSLYHIVSYSYSFVESGLLSTFHPALKSDLMERLAISLTFLISVCAGLVSIAFLPGSFDWVVSARYGLLIAINCWMSCQLVFEVWRAGVCTLGVGLTDNPKVLLANLPWLSEYFSTYV